MADLCETLITDQNSSRFENYEAAIPLVDIDGLNEISVRHPASPLIANAVSDITHWFLCVVAANPPLEVQNAGQLIGSWYGAQYNLLRQSDFSAVVFNDGKTVAPVRVGCGSEDRMIVILGFATDHGKFRVGVTNRLSNSLESPC